jgi:micrococcal nuclease
MIPKLSAIVALGSIFLILIIAIPWTNTDCSGKAMCLKGKITNIVNGDTIDVGDTRVKLSLTTASELDVIEGIEAKNFVVDTCPIGSDVLVDEDDGQIEGGYGRLTGKVFCQGIILNEKILEKGYGQISTFHCNQSEFDDESWAKKYGC